MKYGRASLAKLSTCHKDIQKIFLEVIKVTKVDISITYGMRTAKEQQALWKLGRGKIGAIVTNCDGIYKLSMHQEKIKGEGGRAVDIKIYSDKVGGYDTMHLAYIAGVVDGVVDKLLEKGEISHRLRWGGNWDSDGIIKYDQTLQDFCHWELCDA